MYFVCRKERFYQALKAEFNHNSNVEIYLHETLEQARGAVSNTGDNRLICEVKPVVEARSEMKFVDVGQ